MENCNFDAVMPDAFIDKRRKHRFTVEMAGVPETFVKASGRPTLQVEEREQTAEDGTKFYMPGPHRWLPITVNFYEIDPDKAAALEAWAAGPGSDVTLRIYDGTGAPLQRWKLSEAKASFANFDTCCDGTYSEIVFQFSKVASAGEPA